MATVIIPSTTFTATATLNLFLGTRVNVNTDALGIAWVKNKQYRIELTEGFVKEVGKNISPNPAINNLTTITTNALGPQKTISSPGDNEAFVDNNRSVTVTYDRQIEVGSGNIQLYQSDNTLLATIAVPSAAVTFPTSTQMRISVLGLLRANQSYYYLFDAGVVKDKDGFDSVVISSSVALNYTTSATNDIAFPFPDLSANITGAFSPTLLVGKLKGIVANITTPSFTMSVTARKTARPVVPLTVQATITPTVRADFKLKATTINCTTALTGSVIRRRRVSSNISAVFTPQLKVGFFRNTLPWRGLATEQNALEQNYITQSNVNEIRTGVINLSGGQFVSVANNYLTEPANAAGFQFTQNTILAIQRQNSTLNVTNSFLYLYYNNGNIITTPNNDNPPLYQIDLENPTIIANPNNSKNFGHRVHFDFDNHRMITSAHNETFVFDMNTGALLKTYSSSSDIDDYRSLPISQIKGNRILIFQPTGKAIFFKTYDNDLICSVNDPDIFINNGPPNFGMILNDNYFLTRIYKLGFQTSAPYTIKNKIYDRNGILVQSETIYSSNTEININSLNDTEMMAKTGVNSALNLFRIGPESLFISTPAQYYLRQPITQSAVVNIASAFSPNLQIKITRTTTIQLNSAFVLTCRQTMVKGVSSMTAISIISGDVESPGIVLRGVIVDTEFVALFSTSFSNDEIPYAYVPSMQNLFNNNNRLPTNSNSFHGWQPSGGANNSPYNQLNTTSQEFSAVNQTFNNTPVGSYDATLRPFTQIFPQIGIGTNAKWNVAWQLLSSDSGLYRALSQFDLVSGGEDYAVGDTLGLYFTSESRLLIVLRVKTINA